LNPILVLSLVIFFVELSVDFSFLPPFFDMDFVSSDE